MHFWPVLVIGASVLQVVRNVAQRELTTSIGLWGATYVRFLFGLPFALLWTLGVLYVFGPSGGPNMAFVLWILAGAASQATATAGLLFAMRSRAFAVATAFTKAEVLGTALLGIVMIHDHITTGDWTGIVLGSVGIILMAHISPTREAFQAAVCGVGAGLIFSISSVAYRASAQEWGGDPWVGATASLAASLLLQSVAGFGLMLLFARPALVTMLRAWRACLVPGAAGGISSALLFTGFALGPSAGAVKALALIDVILAWGVSHRMLRERISPAEIIGMALILAGALAVVL